MSKNLCRMLGIILEMLSVFLLLGGLFLGGAGLPAWVPPVCLVAGLVMLTVGVILYKVVHSGD